ncbi:MAG: gamma-glutamyltransferase [Candidatus Velthaea sp.]
MPYSFPYPTRAVARSTRGIVASPSALASAAGLEVLRRGGNAVDAAIAASAVLTVVYPGMCGLGGDAFWLIYEPRSKNVVSYNATGRTPRAAGAEALRERGLREMPLRGAESVTVPGVVRSWEEIGRTHGSRGLDELLVPAERYAREGFACSDVTAGYIAIDEATLRVDPAVARVFLANGTPRAGDIIRNVALADTIAALRTGGADAFYGGAIGEAIVRTLNQGGSAMTLDDLTSHRTEQTEPVRFAWNGGELLEHPPNSQGATVPMALGALQNDAALGEPAWNHRAIEAIKLAFAQRDAYFGDPAFTDVPVADMLSTESLERMREAIDPERAQTRKPAIDRGDTIYLCVVDDEGRAVSFMQSLYMSFGSAGMAEGTGVILHNRGAYFNLTPGHPNEFAGGKRPLHTLAPAMFMQAGRPKLVFGTMGADGQPQTQVQLLHNFFERGMNVQQTIDAPRWIFGRFSIDETSDSVRVEARMPDAVIAGLGARGHHVVQMGDFENTMGHAHAIEIDYERGTLAGGSDPRADSAALGL